jgi:hypothetical protein
MLVDSGSAGRLAADQRMARVESDPAGSKPPRLQARPASRGASRTQAPITLRQWNLSKGLPRRTRSSGGRENRSGGLRPDRCGNEQRHLRRRPDETGTLRSTVVPAGWRGGPTAVTALRRSTARDFASTNQRRSRIRRLRTPAASEPTNLLRPERSLPPVARRPRGSHRRAVRAGARGSRRGPARIGSAWTLSCVPRWRERRSRPLSEARRLPGALH